MSHQLDSLLNQIRYENRPRLKGDVLGLMSIVKTLSAKLGTLMNNDGSELKLVIMTGTMPIYYQSVQYNIPLDVFLPQKYPEEPPKIYIRPTSNMMVHQNHEHVDREGLVFVPYLSEWNTHSNLVDLLTVCSSIFSAEPPLFTRAKTPSPPKAIAPISNTNNNFYRNNQNTNSTNASNGRNVEINNQNAAKKDYRPSEIAAKTRNDVVNLDFNNNSNNYSNQNSVQEKNGYLDLVTKRLQESLKIYYSGIRDNLELEFKSQNTLIISKEEIDLQILKLTNLKSEMEKGASDVEAKGIALDAWMAEREKEANVDCEDYLLPFDDLSVQLVNLQSEQQGLEETIYILEEHLRSSTDSVDNSIPIFLKTIRKLARQLFLVKLHIRKIKSIVTSACK